MVWKPRFATWTNAGMVAILAVLALIVYRVGGWVGIVVLLGALVALGMYIHYLAYYSPLADELDREERRLDAGAHERQRGGQ